MFIRTAVPTCDLSPFEGTTPAHVKKWRGRQRQVAANIRTRHFSNSINIAQCKSSIRVTARRVSVPPASGAAACDRQRAATHTPCRRDQPTATASRTASAPRSERRYSATCLPTARRAVQCRSLHGRVPGVRCII